MSEEPLAHPLDDRGIPWLTDRDLLAHLSTVTIQSQLKPPRSYERVSDSLGVLAEAGEVLLRADDDNVWVIICGEVIVHAARDWLQWTAARTATRESN
jgi:hypothetical protein